VGRSAPFCLLLVIRVSSVFIRGSLLFPGQADEVCEQLDAELREHLRRGPLRLPDPATLSWSLDEP
jgi:hypothetical protein